MFNRILCCQSIFKSGMCSPFNACSMTRASASYEHDLLFRSPSDRIASYFSPSALGLTKLVLREKMAGSAFDSSPPHKPKASATSPRAVKSRSPNSKFSKQHPSLSKSYEENSVQVTSNDLSSEHNLVRTLEDVSVDDSRDCERFSRQRSVRPRRSVYE